MMGIMAFVDQVFVGFVAGIALYYVKVAIMDNLNIFHKKVCCGDKSCDRYWGCMNECDKAARNCWKRKPVKSDPQ